MELLHLLSTKTLSGLGFSFGLRQLQPIPYNCPKHRRQNPCFPLCSPFLSDLSDSCGVELQLK